MHIKDGASEPLPVYVRSSYCALFHSVASNYCATLQAEPCPAPQPAAIASKAPLRIMTSDRRPTTPSDAQAQHPQLSAQQCHTLCRFQSTTATTTRYGGVLHRPVGANAMSRCRNR